MIGVKVHSPDLERLRKRFGDADRIVRKEAEAMVVSSAYILRMEIRNRTPVVTGRLYRSLRVMRRGQTDGIPRMVVESAIPYAPFVENGTRPHDIFPRRAKALHFFIGDREIFCRHVRHPGTSGAHMVRDGTEAAGPRLRAIYREMLANIVTRLRTRGGRWG